jgi:hypothetical protein
MADKAEWYDAVWLNAYHAVCDVVARVQPARLDEFVRAFDVLRTPPGFVPHFAPGFLSPAQLERIRAVAAAIPNARMELHEVASFGRFVVHNLPEFTALQHELTATASAWAGQELEPCYNFLSLYTRMGNCAPHLDSPSAMWTLDICIDQSDPWPIWFSRIVPWPKVGDMNAPDWAEAVKADPALDFKPCVMEPGDAVLFSGSSQWHYRDPLAAAGGKRFCNLLFLHYIPKGSGELLRPANWARMFGIPEIDAIPGIAEAL